MLLPTEHFSATAKHTHAICFPSQLQAVPTSALNSMAFPSPCLVAIAACIFSQWTLPSQCAAPLVVPVQVISSSSVNSCPPEPFLSAAKEQLKADIALTLCAHSKDRICGRGSTEDNPVSSCSDLGTDGLSGYYWILPPNGSQVVQLYCDFDRQCGCDDPNNSAWTRVGFLNMSDPNQACPDTWVTSTSSEYGPSCGTGMDSGENDCISAFFPTSGIPYSRVCGRVIAYHDGVAQALSSSLSLGFDLESSYLEGISLTRGDNGMRQHVWSFITASGEGTGNFHPSGLCNCSNVQDDWRDYTTSFIGDDYFCDTGNHEADWSIDETYYDDPLWDGDGCGPQSTCCQFGNPPWFCKPLLEPTTDNLEIRNCRNGILSYDTLVSLIEIYVQ